MDSEVKKKMKTLLDVRKASKLQEDANRKSPKIPYETAGFGGKADEMEYLFANVGITIGNDYSIS